MFSSKPPRENNDPYPNVWDGHSQYNQMRGDTDMFREGAPYNFERYSYRPRPEFDHVQHNEPNPILVDVRDYWAHANSPIRANQVAIYLEVCDISAIQATPEQVEHAHRILTRLANMKKEI